MVWDAALVKAGAAVVYWVYDDGTMFLIHKVTEGYLPFNIPIDVSGSPVSFGYIDRSSYSG